MSFNDWSEAEQKVFEFIDGVESSGSGVPVGLVVTEIDFLSGVPGFRLDVVLEDAFFDLVDKGFLSMVDFGVARIESYPSGYR